MYILDRCTYTESYSPVHTYTFTGPCVLTGKPYSVKVNSAGLYKYHQGGLIQDCFPELSADDREFMLSGMSPEAWKMTFGEDDENDV